MELSSDLSASNTHSIERMVDFLLAPSDKVHDTVEQTSESVGVTG